MVALSQAMRVEAGSVAHCSYRDVRGITPGCAPAVNRAPGRIVLVCNWRNAQPELMAWKMALAMLRIAEACGRAVSLACSKYGLITCHSPTSGSPALRGYELFRVAG